MSLIKVEMENIMNTAAPRDAVWPTLQSFLKDMNADRSSFFHLPETSTWNAEIGRLQAQLAERMPQVDTFIHLGIGGSGLGAETLVRALAPATAPNFQFLDNIDPDYLWQVLETVVPDK